MYKKYSTRYEICVSFFLFYVQKIGSLKTCVAVTSDLLTQLVDLKLILIACETEYSKLIQVHQLKNQKLRYGQSNDFRRLIKKDKLLI